MILTSKVKPGCQSDPTLFYPQTVSDLNHGREICRKCPLVEQCRRSAVDGGETGLWGGNLYRRGKKLNLKTTIRWADADTLANEPEWAPVLNSSFEDRWVRRVLAEDEDDYPDDGDWQVSNEDDAMTAISYLCSHVPSMKDSLKIA